MCPNFGHPALTLSFTIFNFLQVKKSFATILNGLSVLKSFQLSNGDLLFSLHAYSPYSRYQPVQRSRFCLDILCKYHDIAIDNLCQNHGIAIDNLCNHYGTAQTICPKSMVLSRQFVQ